MRRPPFRVVVRISEALAFARRAGLSANGSVAKVAGRDSHGQRRRLSWLHGCGIQAGVKRFLWSRLWLHTPPFADRTAHSASSKPVKQKDPP